MTSNYDVFFVFGKEKKLQERIFLGGVGEVEDSGVRVRVSGVRFRCQTKQK
jgi:hypothetical protein